MLVSPSVTMAQTVGPFADLARRLDAGDSVRIEGRDGVAHAGKVVVVSPDDLVVDTDTGRRRFSPVETARVIRHGDSVLNGAVIGFCPGFLLGVQIDDAVLEASRPAGGSTLKNGLIGGAITAAIGMAIDTARRTETEVYVADPIRVTLAPAISTRALGASLTLRW
jgi:hypothetical protein